MRKRIVVALVAALMAAGTVTAAALPVPNPDPCAFTGTVTQAKMQAYNDCRFDRIEAAIPGNQTVTVTAAPTTVTAPPVTVTVTASPTASPSPSSSSPSPSPTSSPPTSQSSTSPPSTTPPSQPAVLDLPRIPWEGGPAYYSQFANAKKGGWDQASFFPIGIWYAGISSDAEAQFDKSKGINTYVGMDPNTDFTLFKDNGLFWLGGPLRNWDATSGNAPGLFLDDEVDGYISPTSAGFAHLQQLKEANAGSGRFAYANFTQLVVGPDMPLADQQKFVNAYTDVVSTDMYWYTIPFCSWSPYRGGGYAVPVPQDTCRTASSYGKMMEALAIRDASDGKLQPRWQFLENLNGLSGQAHVGYVTPAQLKGAAMSSIINEARGLFWFNQSFSGDCQASNVIRIAQVNPTACGGRIKANVDAMGEVNNLVKSLAPVINTQSYQWKFGDGLDTMLKVKDSAAYIFAMTDGTSGARTFTLPAGITGATVEVIGESRSLPVAGGTFTDTFAAESTYHVYRIAL